MMQLESSAQKLESETTEAVVSSVMGARSFSKPRFKKYGSTVFHWNLHLWCAKSESAFENLIWKVVVFEIATFGNGEMSWPVLCEPYIGARGTFQRTLMQQMRTKVHCFRFMLARVPLHFALHCQEITAELSGAYDNSEISPWH